MSSPGGPYGPGPGWSPPPRPRHPDAVDYVLIATGGILMAVSPVLPWVSSGITVDLFRWTSIDDSVSLLPWLMVGAGIALAVAAYRRAAIANLALGGAVAAAVAALAGAHDVYDIPRVTGRGLLSAMGFGVPVALVALVLLVVAAVRVHLRHRTQGTAGRGGPRRVAWGRPAGARVRPQRTRPITEAAPFDVSPGWKPDPWGVGNTQRYWDGRSWTNQTNYRP